MKYCEKCGKQIAGSAQFCPSCGGRQFGNQHTNGEGPVSKTAAQTSTQAATSTIITTISEREKIAGILWIVVAILQVVAACALGFLSFFLGGGGFTIVLLIIFAAINFFAGYNNFKFSKDILTSPVGITGRYKGYGYIVTLVYNSIIAVINIADGYGFGTVVMLFAMGASIFELTIRSYALQNETELEHVEGNVVESPTNKQI